MTYITKQKQVEAWFFNFYPDSNGYSNITIPEWALRYLFERIVEYGDYGVKGITDMWLVQDGAVRTCTEAEFKDMYEHLPDSV